MGVLPARLDAGRADLLRAERDASLLLRRTGPVARPALLGCQYLPGGAVHAAGGLGGQTLAAGGAMAARARAAPRAQPALVLRKTVAGGAVPPGLVRVVAGAATDVPG